MREGPSLSSFFNGFKRHCYQCHCSHALGKYIAGGLSDFSLIQLQAAIATQTGVKSKDQLLFLSFERLKPSDFRRVNSLPEIDVSLFNLFLMMLLKKCNATFFVSNCLSLDFMGQQYGYGSQLCVTPPLPIFHGLLECKE